MNVCILYSIFMVQVLQKVIQRDPMLGVPETQYYCTLYNLAGSVLATQTLVYDGKVTLKIPRTVCCCQD